MRCLVTGASGHLGSYLTRLLVGEGAEVIALVRPESDLWRLTDVLDRVRLIYCDLASIQQSAAAIRVAAPEVAFHLAWFGVTSGQRNDTAQITANVIGSLELARTVLAAGCQCWVGVGSQAEYGPYNGRLVESLPTRPVTAYGVSKLSVGLLAEKLCEFAGTRYVWLRLLATYGPQDDERHLIPSLIRQLLARQRPALTLGEQQWDYLHVSDAAQAIYRVAVVPEAQGVFNLGSGDAHPIKRIAERIRDLIDPTLPLGFGEIAYNPDQIMHLQADISKLQEATAWSPTIPLDEGLKQTVEWYKRKLVLE